MQYSADWPRPHQSGSNASAGQGSLAKLSSANSQPTAQLDADNRYTPGAYPFASINTLASIADASSVNAPAKPSISQPADICPIIKHIPRSARQHIATELSSALSQCSDPDDVSNWSTLLEFGSVTLRAPLRADRRHSLAYVLNKRSISTYRAPPVTARRPAPAVTNIAMRFIQQSSVLFTEDPCCPM